MELPGEKLLGRLWETLADKGIGSLLRPWQIRREGRARAEANRDELLLLAQAEHDADEIRIGRRRLLSDGSTVARGGAKPLLPARGVDPSTSSFISRSISESVNEATFADTLRKEVNVAKAILYAENELAEDPAEPSTEQVDDDWLFRWRDSASGVSTEYLQQMWGKVLAGEIKAPKTFSLRTLEFLRNVSQDEAKEIEVLATFVIDGLCVYRDLQLLEAAGADFGFFLRMQELGLLIGVDAQGLKRTFPSAEPTRFLRPLFGGEFGLLTEHDDPATVLTLPVYEVTPIGRQVIALGVSQTNLSYLRAAGQAICKQGYRVQLIRYVRDNAESYRYFDPEPLCPRPALETDRAKPEPI